MNEDIDENEGSLIGIEEISEVDEIQGKHVLVPKVPDFDEKRRDFFKNSHGVVYARNAKTEKTIAYFKEQIAKARILERKRFENHGF